MNTIRVLAVDPHEVVRAGLRAILGAEPGVCVVGEAADSATAVRLAHELYPDMVVAEALPGTLGEELIARLCEVRTDLKVLALTACEDGGALRQMLAAGAVGYVLKRSGAEELVRAVRAVASGAIHLDPALAAHAADLSAHAPADRERPAELSAREAEVVRLIALGYSNKEVAGRLRVSIKTVETYKTRSMEKLDLRGRVDIVRYAARRGWLARDDDEALAVPREWARGTPAVTENG